MSLNHFQYCRTSCTAWCDLILLMVRFGKDIRSVFTHCDGDPYIYYSPKQRCPLHRVKEPTLLYWVQILEKVNSNVPITIPCTTKALMETVNFVQKPIFLFFYQLFLDSYMATCFKLFGDGGVMITVPSSLQDESVT